MPSNIFPTDLSRWTKKVWICFMARKREKESSPKKLHFQQLSNDPEKSKFEFGSNFREWLAWITGLEDSNNQKSLSHCFNRKFFPRNQIDGWKKHQKSIFKPFWNWIWMFYLPNLDKLKEVLTQNKIIALPVQRKEQMTKNSKKNFQKLSQRQKPNK